MTREKAIETIKEAYGNTEYTDRIIQALEQESFDIETYCKEHFCVMVDKDVWEKAEKALEQKPKTIQEIQAESEKYQKAFEDGYDHGYAQARFDYEQEPKTGYWFVDERPESDREIICSNCEQPIFKYHKLDFDYRPEYCPNCGAKMESEDKE